ncbi:hypothetical protein [Fuerstiella marisgermanici]|uniref:Uncharacterized protein n=1 Tax=Fuerstiella marisgermanici TaxID=1891926 RepID=A0A1P8WBW4_9PLAN|nr:hypothetical protein [Fuerstiella marisgermanici]APZ91558.1 hypothetical protein Fuma_01147 [Fuerstiella marisgermanici]APZ91593.1 hypothetical protein Fuma_01182 [Fuerstiella marisgermanici]
MVGRKRGDISKALARGRDRFEAWRRTRKVGARIPVKLWSLAVKLVETHGLSRTSSALKLDYHSLKKRVAAKDVESDSVAPAFIELPPPSPTASTECVVEFADGSGASLRVHLRGCEVPDLVALGRSFWSGE